MDGSGRIRPGPLAGVVAGHAMATTDPVTAAAVSGALFDSVVQTTQSSYATGERRWMKFCLLRGLQPYPVDRLWFCGWLLRLASSVLPSSMKMYMAGVRYHQQLAGFNWNLRGDQLVARVLRYLKRRIPCRDKAAKVPVTSGLLRRILPLLVGWPVLADMSEDDAVFCAASIVGTTGFLRGGEFLSSKSSVRATLRRADLRVRELSMGKAVVVSVRQPKARWWLHDVEVPCFANEDDPVWCPVRVWEEYASKTSGADSQGPAFLRNGAALDRDFMVKRTDALMQRAGISFVSPTGEKIAVKMASWRSGGVRSAMDAGLSEEMIRMLGRWRSSAWRNYLLHSSTELQGAARSLWRTQLPESPAPCELRVAECDVGGCFVQDIRTVNEEVKEVEEVLDTIVCRRGTGEEQAVTRRLVLRSAQG